MTNLLVVTIAGFFLISLKVARAQQEVKPLAAPPMLETPRPLDNLETKEPAAPRDTPVSRKSIFCRNWQALCLLQLTSPT
jgi:hypothetical protein